MFGIFSFIFLFSSINLPIYLLEEENIFVLRSSVLENIFLNFNSSLCGIVGLQQHKSSTFYLLGSIFFKPNSISFSSELISLKNKADIDDLLLFYFGSTFGFGFNSASIKLISFLKF